MNRIPPSPCIHCGHINDAAENVSGDTCQSGDIAVCFYCAGVMQYNDEMKLVPITNEELLEEPKLKFVVDVIKANLNQRKRSLN